MSTRHCKRASPRRQYNGAAFAEADARKTGLGADLIRLRAEAVRRAKARQSILKRGN